MQLSSQTKIADLIHAHPSVLLMLEHFEIGFPLNEKTVEAICNEKAIGCELFLTFINLFTGTAYAPVSNYNLSDIDIILSYLKNSHKYYLDEIYPKISFLISEMNVLNNLAEVHMVETFFTEYFSEVKEHIDYETRVVFPYVSSLVLQLANQTPPQNQINYSVTEYKEHHNDIEEKLDDFKNLLIKYLPQSNDATMRRKLLLSLFELENDLGIHSQIEDTILIPLVEEMERKLQLTK